MLVLDKILAVIFCLYKMVVYFITLKKGQVTLANIGMNHAIIHTINNKSGLVLDNVDKANFNEKNKTITFVNNLGTFTFNLDTITSLHIFDDRYIREEN